MLDVDFVPSAGLRQQIVLAASTSLSRKPRLALVVPAFEPHSKICERPGSDPGRRNKGLVRVPDVEHGEVRRESAQWCRARLNADFDDLLPATQSRLAACIAAGRCDVFQKVVNHDGHSSTDTARWFGLPQFAEIHSMDTIAASPETVVRPIRCFRSSRYEPYVVLRRGASTPPYDERFSGYGKNKIEHLTHLRSIGFEFAVLPKGFVIHVPHPRGLSKSRWLSSEETHGAVDNLFHELKAELFGGNATTPGYSLKTRLCDDPLLTKSMDPRNGSDEKGSSSGGDDVEYTVVIVVVVVVLLVIVASVWVMHAAARTRKHISNYASDDRVVMQKMFLQPVMA